MESISISSVRPTIFRERGILMKKKVVASLIFLLLLASMGVASASTTVNNFYLHFNGNTDGTGSYVEVKDSPSLHLANRFTIDVWVNWDGRQGYRTFISKPSSTTTTGFSFVMLDGKPSLAIMGNSNNGLVNHYVQAPTAIPANTWINLAATFDGRHMTVYENGTQVASDDLGTNVSVLQGNTPLLIGREFQNSLLDRSFGGNLHDLKIWNIALSGKTIAQMLKRPPFITPNRSSLVGYWPFYERSGYVAHDVSGHNLNGTLYNGAVWWTGLK